MMKRLTSLCGAFGLRRKNRKSNRASYIVPTPPSNSHANMCNNFKIGDSDSTSFSNVDQQNPIILMKINADEPIEHVAFSITISPSVIGMFPLSHSFLIPSRNTNCFHTDSDDKDRSETKQNHQEITETQVTPTNHSESDDISRDILQGIIQSIVDGQTKEIELSNTNAIRAKIPEGFEKFDSKPIIDEIVKCVLKPKVFFNDKKPPPTQFSTDCNQNTFKIITKSKSSSPMSTEKAMDTIMKYSDNESTPASQHIITEFIEGPTVMMIPKIDTANLLTPRISKLENMVESVVTTNVKLLQNFEEFVQKYKLEKMHFSPSTNSSSIKFAESLSPHFKTAQIYLSQQRKRKRSNSENKRKRMQQRFVRNKSDCRQYKSDRGPRLNTAHRAHQRRSFDMERKQRMRMEREAEKKTLRELRLMEERVKLERARKMRYKASPVRKYKATKITLPKRKLRIRRVGIYERGLERKKNKEMYYEEMRRIRDLQMGISPVSKRKKSKRTGMDVEMRNNGCESRLKVMQTLKLRQR